LNTKKVEASSPGLRTLPLKMSDDIQFLFNAQVTIMPDVSAIITHLRNLRLIMDVSVRP
jgi:hypothetical protein